MDQVLRQHSNLIEKLWVRKCLIVRKRGIKNSLTFWESFPEDSFIRLTRTFEPLNTPSYTHPRRGSGSMHDFGSTSLMPHILLSSWSGGWNKPPDLSGMPTRTYTGIEHGGERGCLEAYLRCPDTQQAMSTPRLVASAKGRDTHPREENCQVVHETVATFCQVRGVVVGDCAEP